MEHLSQRSQWLIIGRAVGIALLISLIALLLAAGPLKPLELFSSDLLFRWRGNIQEDAPIILVAIDEASFDQSQLQWPWPRDYLARIVEGISAGNPKVIAVDIILEEPSVEEEDQAFARALADAGNVILVNQISTETRGGITVTTLGRPIPMFDEVATLGLTNFPRDEDGKVRTLLGFREHNDELYFSWSLQAARMYLGEEGFNVISRDRIQIGDHDVRLEGQFLRVNFRGAAAETIQYYSAYQVAEEGFVNPQVFEDKIVILGATTETLHDNYPVPYGTEPMPGAEINAHAMDTVLNQRYVESVGLAPEIFITLIAAFLGVLLTLRTRPLVGLFAVVGVLLIYALVSFLMFTNVGLILPHVAPMLGVFLTFVVNTSIQVYEEQRQRARVRSLFDRYISSAAIDQMLEQPESLALSGQRREMSIMFSDIRGFTSLSEQLTPDQVVEILNEYLGEMTDIIFKYEGTVDKFEGDAILAIWNAPLDVEEFPTKAVECAIEMAHHLAELQKRWAATGQLVLRNGIGITTGTVFVGNIGSEQRMDYTVIGDTVNLAARLEALTKEVGVQILYNQETYDKLNERIRSKFVASATVKGREQPVDVYTPDPEFHQLDVEQGVTLDEMPARITQVSKE